MSLYKHHKGDLTTDTNTIDFNSHIIQLGATYRLLNQYGWLRAYIAGFGSLRVLPVEETSLEHLDELLLLYSTLYLEDKVFIDGGTDDMNNKGNSYLPSRDDVPPQPMENLNIAKE